MNEHHNAAGFLIIWSYIVKAEHRQEFERAYASDGDWAEFFRQSDEYLGTDLKRDNRNPVRYITLDYWSSENAYRSFAEQHQQEYQKLDRRFEAWTEQEVLIGEFSPI